MIRHARLQPKHHCKVAKNQINTQALNPDLCPECPSSVRPGLGLNEGTCPLTWFLCFLLAGLPSALPHGRDPYPRRGGEAHHTESQKPAPAPVGPAGLRVCPQHPGRDPSRTSSALQQLQRPVPEQLGESPGVWEGGEPGAYCWSKREDKATRDGREMPSRQGIGRATMLEEDGSGTSHRWLPCKQIWEARLLRAQVSSTPECP